MGIRLRHLRHRMLDGLGRGRLDHLKAKLVSFGGLNDIQTFTAAATDICTATGHGYDAGVDGPFVVTTAGVLPAGLEGGVLYYTGEIDANTFYLHLTRADANADLNRVDITTVGTGVHSISRP